MEQTEKQKNAILHWKYLTLNTSPTFDESLVSSSFTLSRFFLDCVITKFDQISWLAQ